MKKAPDWTNAEFDVLLQNSTLSDEALSTRLPRRTLDAIQVVRSGIHEFHQKGESALLSKMMKERLAMRGENLVCSICGEEI